MANILSLTVYQVDNAPLVPAKTIPVPANSFIKEGSLSGIDAVNSIVLVFDEFGAAKTYYVSETVAALVASANEATTVLVQATVTKVGNSSTIVNGQQMAFPADQISLLNNGSGSKIIYRNTTYLATESVATIISDANTSSDSGGGVESVTAGANQTATVDNTDAANPVISSGIKVATVTLTDEQIKALPTTAVEIVPAPGEGKFIHPISGFAILNTTAGAYSDVIGANFDIKYPTPNSSCHFPAAGALGGTNITRINFAFPILFTGEGDYEGGSVTGSSNLSGIENQPLNIIDDFNGIPNYTGGNAANTLKVTVYYIEVTL